MTYKFSGGPEDGVETTFDPPPPVGHVFPRLVQYKDGIQILEFYIARENGLIEYDGTVEVPPRPKHG